jgi:Protein of unknown function (DUF3891)
MFRSKRRAVVFPQMNHAAFAGGVALLWKEVPLPRESFVRGVALHDRGYGELDNDPIGGVARERWLEIQHRGFAMRDADPIVDLIACMHITRLVRGAVPEFEEALPDLRERAGVDEATALAADAITNLCDRISFDVCCEEATDGGIGEIAYDYDGDRTVTVEPWPFAVDEFSLLLVGFRADGYPQRLERVLEPVAFRRSRDRKAAAA